MKCVLSPLARARRRGQRGAVAVEAALVTPILITMVLGIIEFSLVLRDYVAISSSVRVGARIASASPNAGMCATTIPECTGSPAGTPLLAQTAANAIQRAGTAMPNDSIDYIFVYKSNDKGYPGPDTNTAMPSSMTACANIGNCVAFKWVDLSDRFAYQTGSWITKNVNACPTNSDAVGVYMHVTHANLTGFFGDSVGLGDRTVMRFEPLSTAICTGGSAGRL